MSFVPFFLQDATATTGQVGGGGFTMLLPLILIVLIMYFFMIRPQSKKQKETEKMIAALKKGDKVVTIGGIHGTVSSTKEHTVIVKVDDDTKIEFNRSAIATVLVDKPAAVVPEKKSLFGKKKTADTSDSESTQAENSSDTEAKTDE
ncbi:MAG: preprotein translocase subunit YajC [Treponema sp.]|nr:preprotein translocase subunit YajC [Treponema sp.]